jgi:hypothetical protein
MNVTGAVQHIEHLAGLSDGTEQRIVTPLPWG